MKAHILFLILVLAVGLTALPAGPHEDSEVIPEDVALQEIMTGEILKPLTPEEAGEKPDNPREKREVLKTFL